jgi:3-oxoacyl-[acyl-carrier-protein] synthase II
MANNHSIVITGIGSVSPLGASPEELWRGLIQMESGIRLVEGMDRARLSCVIGGVCRTDSADPALLKFPRYIRLAHLAARQAWEMSGISVAESSRHRYGVYVGVSMGDNEAGPKAHAAFEGADYHAVPALTSLHLLACTCPGLLAAEFGLHGPAKAVDAACASSATAISDAVLALQAGIVDAMLVVGAESTIDAFTFAMFDRLGALSARNDAPEESCRPFDRDRDGFVIGEGAAALVLETAAHAQQRGMQPLARIRGIAVSCDAFHPFRPPPAGEGAQRTMKAALDDAGLAPSDIGYVNAHATGTRIGDEAEAAAISAVFGDHSPWVTSTKANTGHLAGAAGALEANVCILALQAQTIPAQRNCPNPDVAAFVQIPNETVKLANKAVMSNSFGFGGINASIILTA